MGKLKKKFSELSSFIELCLDMQGTIHLTDKVKGLDKVHEHQTIT